MPSSDFHYLTAFSRLSSSQMNDGLASKVIAAVIAMDAKLDGRQRRIKQTWSQRLSELVQMIYAKLPTTKGRLDQFLEQPAPPVAIKVGLSPQPVTAEETERWKARFGKVNWSAGDATRGTILFQARACASCHEGAGAIGPELAGAAKRLSPGDLMLNVALPSLDVAPAFRATTFRMKDGQSYTGFVVFLSADGYIVQTGPGANVRLDADKVLSQEESSLSLMPSGLLDGLNDEELADLFASIKSRTAE